jgi:biopolymer transport protein TolR
MQEFESDDDAITGINVTPLVDVTLVLLIIFMVTARFIAEPSIGVKLPKTSTAAPGEASDQNVFLTINEQHEIFLNNAHVTREQLGSRIKELQQSKPNMNLVLRADKSIPHGEVISVLDEVRNQGITQFGIAVEGKQ